MSQKEKQTLPAMYCIPNMHKNPTSAHFLIASKISCFFCIKVHDSEILKMVFSIRTTVQKYLTDFWH